MFEQKQIIANGLVVNYLVRDIQDADKPVMVFLHGWRSSSAQWLPVLPAFGQYRIIAFDLPGFGKSQTPSETFTFDDYVDTAVQALKQLGIQSCILVGHSFGGRISIALAAQFPDMVQKLVLVDASGIQLHTANKKLIGIVAHMVKPVFSLSILKPIRARLYHMIGADDYLATPQLQNVFVRVVGFDVRPLLAHIKAPTLIVWGDRDTETPLIVGRTMQQKISRAELVVLKQAGHMSFLEKSLEFEQAVLKFLNT